VDPQQNIAGRENLLASIGKKTVTVGEISDTGTIETYSLLGEQPWPDRAKIKEFYGLKYGFT
jgi:hypothetical protein